MLSSKTVFAEGLIDAAANGVAGLFLLIPKLGLVALGDGVRLLLGLFSGRTLGNSIPNVAGNLLFNGVAGVTVQDVLFNKIDITDIDFFNFNSSDQTVVAIRENVAMWYIGIRNLAAVLLVIVALYVGIRMAISTIAEDRAKYKQMLIDWITSVCVLFLLHYIMVFIIQTNNTIVKTMADQVNNNNLEDITIQFRDFAVGGRGLTSVVTGTVNGFTEGFVPTFIAAIVYLGLEFLTLVFLLTYIKRMITIGFLIIIAPLVTITYSIDKMGDGRSQALNQWIKEFTYNILIQPFQCVTYLALCSTSFDLLKNNGDFKTAIIVISMMIFLLSSEKIIRHIFNFRAESMADSIATAGITASAFRTITSAGKKMFGESGTHEKAKIPKAKDENTLPANRSANIQTTEINDGQQTPGLGETTNNQNQPGGAYQANNNTSQATQNGQPGVEDTYVAYEPETNRAGEELESRNRNRRIGKAVRRAGSTIGNIILGANAMAFGAGVGIATGIGTGETKAALLATIEGVGMGFDWANTHAKNSTSNHYKREVARSFEDYKAALRESGAEVSDSDIAQYGLELLDGTRQAETQEERAYRDALLDMQSNFMQNGDDEKASLKNVRKVIEGVRDGEITEQSAPVRFFGNISSKIKRKGNRNGSSNSTRRSQTARRRTQPDFNTPPPTVTQSAQDIDTDGADIGGSQDQPIEETEPEQQDQPRAEQHGQTRTANQDQPRAEQQGQTRTAQQNEQRTRQQGQAGTTQQDYPVEEQQDQTRAAQRRQTRTERQGQTGETYSRTEEQGQAQAQERQQRRNNNQSDITDESSVGDNDGSI